MKLKDKVAIITGSSRGIGRATAELFAKEGAKVVIVYKQNEKEAKAVESIIGLDNCLLVPADLTNEKDVKRVVEETLKTFKKIDILINNAGEIVRPGDWKSDIDTWHQTIDANLTSTWLMIREVAPTMQKQSSGVIVNTSSIYGILGAAPVLAYTAAKAGVINLTKSFAKELAPSIRVNVVVPGNVWTDMTKDAGDELIEHFKSITPMKRLAEPEEIAKAVLFLASDDASYITGAELVVDGGYLLK